jgi:hypothetical protein
MIVCMTRHPARNFRPDPDLYAQVERIAEDAGVSMNVFLQALLRELIADLAADPDRRLAVLAPHLEAVAAATPPRGRRWPNRPTEPAADEHTAR